MGRGTRSWWTGAYLVLIAERVLVRSKVALSYPVFQLAAFEMTYVPATSGLLCNFSVLA